SDEWSKNGEDWSQFTDTLKQGWEDFKEWVKGFIGDIWDTIKTEWDTQTAALSETWGELWEGVKTAWDDFKEWCKGFISGVWDTIKEEWNTQTSEISETWGDLWDECEQL